jgi:regulatory protein
MNLIAENGLRKGMALDEDACRSMLLEDLYFKALKRCVDYLAYRPRSMSEIQKRLQELQAPETTATRVIDRLNELGYLDDERFALQWAESRHRSKGYGPRRLESELIQKGISADMARKAVAEACTQEDIEAQLLKGVSKARHKYRHEGDERKRDQKIIGFLSRRGFDIGAIRDTIRQTED